MSIFQLTPGAIATLACCLEVAAPKPGNVHRGADFEDARFQDFMTSGVILGQVIDQYPQASLGQNILNAVTANIDTVATNTNLGIILLLVPLAKAINPTAMKDRNRLDENSVSRVFDELASDDARLVFQAIRAANPGGLGKVERADVRHEGIEDEIGLLEAMELAADIDLVARQYVRRFKDLFSEYLPILIRAERAFSHLTQAIVYLHLHLMARHPDSLIWRKCGEKTARQSQMMAAGIIDQYPLALFEQRTACVFNPTTLAEDGGREPENQDEFNFWKAVADLDFWLRSDGHRRNPGTTADLVTATLFAGIARGDLRPPFR